MYSQRIDGENKTTWRLGEATRNYYRKIEENRLAADEAFDRLMSQQRLASVGAALELNRTAKPPGLAACAEDCSCLYCQKQSELKAIAQRGLTASAAIEQQKVASVNGGNKDNSTPVHRQPKWKMRYS